jgi:hypothetical protein
MTFPPRSPGAERAAQKLDDCEVESVEYHVALNLRLNSTQSEQYYTDLDFSSVQLRQPDSGTAV